MLQSFKDRIRGSRWLGYVIVGIISVPFVLWGIQAYMRGGGSSVAATVNGTDIPSRQVERRVAQQRQQLRQRFGGNLPDAFTDKMLRGRVVEQMITRELLRQQSASANLQVTSDQLAARIRSQSTFQRDGEFDRDLYRQILRRSGMSPSQYESQVRQGARIEQLRAGIAQSSFVLDGEARRVAMLAGQQREVDTLRYSREAARAKVELDDADLQSYYEAHKDRFRKPEQVRLQYVQLDLDALKGQVDVSEQELKNEYDAAGQRYREAAAREAAHILIDVPADADGETADKALQRIRDLRERIVDGDADFAALARQYSDDSGSAGEGGDLGYVTRGMMAKPFEEALFSLPEKGAVSEPVRTKYGYHLIKLLDIRERRQKPFEEVRDQIRDDLKTRRADSRFYERAEVLKNTAFENPDSLQAVADATGLKVQQSGWFSRESGEGFTSDTAVRKAAFSERVLQERRNSDVIELGKRSLAIVRVSGHRDAEPRPLDAVREQVRKAAIAERVDQRLEDWSKGVVERLDDGDTPEEIAGGDVEMTDLGWIGESGGEVDQVVARTAFGLHPPEKDGLAYRAATLSDGARAVVLLRGVRLAEPGDSAVQQAARRRSSQVAQAELRAWIEALREDADIQRYDEDGDPRGENSG